MPDNGIRLIITNGSSGIDAIQNAGINATYMSWDDVLHDGPVPATDSLEELSDVRAKFITRRGWGNEQEIRDRFKKRDDQFLDAVKKGADQPEEIILWFEHDLYDQLQLIQILFEIGRLQTRSLNLSMICHDHYIGLTPVDQLAADFESRRAVSSVQINMATEAWRAFTSSKPGRLKAFQENEAVDTLPFLSSALNRMLEEIPGEKDGISRTERTILRCLEDGPLSGGQLFRAQQKTEEAIFMGDGSFEHVLTGMLSENRELIKTDRESDYADATFPTTSFEITPLGGAVLAGSKSARNHAPVRWIGGCRINP